eukprot:8835526-Pyramimonas_sp.AAC.1
MCPLRGTEEGAHVHLHWHCRAPECEEIREKLAGLESDASLRDIIAQGDAAQDSWLWSRGLVKGPMAEVDLQMPEAELLW